MIEVSATWLFGTIITIIAISLGFIHKRLNQIEKNIKEDDKSLSDELKTLTKQVNIIAMAADKSPSETRVNEIVDKKYKELKADVKADISDLSNKFDTLSTTILNVFANDSKGGAKNG